MFSCEFCEISKNTYFEEHLRTAASELILGLFRTSFLDSRFQNHHDLVILQKYESLSNQGFKRNSVHMPTLNLTLRFLLKIGFICSSLTVTTEKANSCSPWTSC